MTNQPKTEKAKALVAKATRVGVVCGVPFYEHPTLGDECPLLYITADGRVKVSDHWELPDPLEYVETAPLDAFPLK